MKYRDNMTPQEQAALLREIEGLDAAYARAAESEASNSASGEEDAEDEMELLRRAALNHRGQP